MLKLRLRKSEKPVLSPPYRVDLNRANLRYLSFKTKMSEGELLFMIDNMNFTRTQVFFEFREGTTKYVTYLEDVETE